MRSNPLVLWTLLFDVYQFALLLVVANGMFTGDLTAALLIIVVGMKLDTDLVSIAALLQTSVVNLSAPVKHPLQFFGCLLVRVNTILVGFDATSDVFEHHIHAHISDTAHAVRTRPEGTAPKLFLYFGKTLKQLWGGAFWSRSYRSEEHTSELQSHSDLVC